MVACEPSGQWEEHEQRPSGRKLSISEELDTVRCAGGGDTVGLKTGPDQVGACRPGSSLVRGLENF